jgi:hypothetical protein
MPAAVGTRRPAQILDRDRHPVEWPTDLAAHDLGLGRAGLDQRRLSHHMGIALEAAVEPFDTRQLGGRGLYRRDFACVKTAGQFGKFKMVEGCSHGRLPLVGPTSSE